MGLGPCLLPLAVKAAPGGVFRGALSGWLFGLRGSCGLGTGMGTVRHPRTPIIPSTQTMLSH